MKLPDTQGLAKELDKIADLIRNYYLYIFGAVFVAIIYGVYTIVKAKIGS